ncbi:MAG: Type cbb3 cytochrome oxidase biosis protein CcoI [Myxococcaceae bacterium]|nr:Type cbb3 cytochrome oxidase biosis protein CcoI [Myxococcaceae bacterium]
MTTEAFDETGLAEGACRHCGGDLGAGARAGFCCAGCRVVNGLLSSGGLLRYYDLRGGVIGPAAPATAARDVKWLDAVEATLASAEGPRRVDLDLQGVQCAACVWLVDSLFARHGAQASRLAVTVNPALGRVELLVTRDFPLRDFVDDVGRFGYALGPALKAEAPRSSALLGRIGLCAAFAMNAMIFAIPVHLGLRDGAVYAAFRWASMLLALASVAVGGSVFIGSAWRSLRRGVLHLDVPIALGVVLAYAGSLWNFLAGRDGGAFFDTVCVFIALMLTGRWLQERVVERNRALLLASDGAEGLLARRVRGGRVEVVRCGELVEGDDLLVAPGDLVPVAAELTSGAASLSLDWITGESAPAAFARGDVVPAGASNLGAEAVTVRAREAFADSSLRALLRSTRADAADAARATPWWQRVTRVYVAAVLSLAALCFAYWFGWRHDPVRALQATTALLVVTCPCAFGLATPTAYEMALAGLRRAGLFVRSASLLDRLPEVRRVVFDKTGTLTTGALRLLRPEALDELPDDARAALYNLVVRSTHPKSVAVRRALDASEDPADFDASLAVREVPGAGVELAGSDGVTWRLGRGAWAATEATGDLVLARSGAAVASLETAEELRPDAREEVAALAATGREVWILSGDEPARVAAMARALGLPPDRAVGGCSPADKARWIDAHDRRDTWMIGDGINDGPAVERAFCSATPTVDRPFMPARTDAWFVTAGLRPVRLALLAAAALARVHRRNLAVATVYNVGTVALAFAGLMSPLLCAIVMPLTSLSILLATVASLSPGRPLWRS